MERYCGICIAYKSGNSRLGLYADFAKNHNFDTNLKGSANMGSG